MRFFRIISMIMAVMFFAVAGFMYFKAEQIASYPTATGIVTKSDIVKGMSDGSVMYSASVSYRYQVDGKDYVSDQFGPTSFSTSSRSTIEEDLRPYPVDAEIQVLYNPEDPSEAYLQAGGLLFSIIFGGVGLLVALLSLFLPKLFRNMRTGGRGDAGLDPTFMHDRVHGDNEFR